MLTFSNSKNVLFRIYILLKAIWGEIRSMYKKIIETFQRFMEVINDLWTMHICEIVWGDTDKGDRVLVLHESNLLEGDSQLKEKQSRLKWWDAMKIMREESAFCSRIKKGCVDAWRPMKAKHQKGYVVGFTCWHFLVFHLHMYNILFKNFYKLHGYERKRECLIEGVFNKPWRWCLISTYVCLYPC